MIAHIKGSGDEVGGGGGGCFNCRNTNGKATAAMIPNTILPACFSSSKNCRRRCC